MKVKPWLLAVVLATLVGGGWLGWKIYRAHQVVDVYIETARSLPDFSAFGN